MSAALALFRYAAHRADAFLMRLDERMDRRMYPEVHAAYETPRRGGETASPPPADAGRRPDADTSSP